MQVFPINKVTFGKHKMVLLDNVDAQDASGGFVQIAAWTEPKYFNKPNEALVRERHLKQWAQSIVSCAEVNIIAGKDNQGVITKVDIMSTEDLSKKINNDVKSESENIGLDTCFYFQDRFLDWIKVHLPVSDMVQFYLCIHRYITFALSLYRLMLQKW